jgi:amino acid adenylation domain-containing protein
MGRTILWDIADIAHRQREAPAIHFANAAISYGDLWQEALGLSQVIGGRVGGANDVGRPVILLTDRSLLTFSGVLAVMLSGNVCVPISPRLDQPRALQIVLQSGAKVIVVDASCYGFLDGLLSAIEFPIDVIYAEEDEAPALREPANVSRHAFDPDAIGALPWYGGLEHVDERALAYLLFTSGSTGTPKGVPVSHRNLTAYCRAIMRELPLRAEDRTSQFFEPTFDLFMHDLFVTLASGASFCVPSEQDLMAPARYIAEFGVTVWFSVPYLGKLTCQQLGRDWSAMASLHTVLFCGEALPRHVAAEWARGLPQVRIYNLYGPTEATIAFSIWLYRADCLMSTLPIGRPLGELEMLVISESGEDVTSVGGLGEIWLGGEQVVGGYFRDEERTQQSFVERQFCRMRSTRWYRTGDLATSDSAEGLLFKGRADFQVKIRGYRVELGEVEAAVQGILGVHTAVVVPWPLDSDDAPLGLVAVASGTALDETEFLAACARALTGYMRPSRLFQVASLPATASGKIDLKAIRSLLATHGRRELAPSRAPAVSLRNGDERDG